jgi:hypothetical protein
MATYQIWADITKIADDRYFVTVSAVPKEERTQDRTGGVTTGEAASMAEAEQLRDELVLQVGKKLRSRGHVIMDLIDDTVIQKPKA